jgi:hypothetical protein
VLPSSYWEPCIRCCQSSRYLLSCPYSESICFYSHPFHYSHFLHLLRYLCGTISCHFFYPCSSSLQSQAYSDVTWASDHLDLRSLSAFLGGSLFAWKTKKEIVVSECRGYWSILMCMSLHRLPLSDSTCAISTAQDPMKYELTKHISVDASFVCTVV